MKQNVYKVTDITVIKANKKTDSLKHINFSNNAACKNKWLAIGIYSTKIIKYDVVSDNDI